MESKCKTCQIRGTKNCEVDPAYYRNMTSCSQYQPKPTEKMPSKKITSPKNDGIVEKNSRDAMNHAERLRFGEMYQPKPTEKAVENKSCETCGRTCKEWENPTECGNYCEHPEKFYQPKSAPEKMPLVPILECQKSEKDTYAKAVCILQIDADQKILEGCKQEWANKLQAILDGNMMLFIREPELNRQLSELIAELHKESEGK